MGENFRLRRSAPFSRAEMPRSQSYARKEMAHFFRTLTRPIARISKKMLPTWDQAALFLLGWLRLARCGSYVICQSVPASLS
jgi:hypothetical protein